jgi:hypothetical protein
VRLLKSGQELECVELNALIAGCGRGEGREFFTTNQIKHKRPIIIVHCRVLGFWMKPIEKFQYVGEKKNAIQCLHTQAVTVVIDGKVMCSKALPKPTEIQK